MFLAECDTLKCCVDNPRAVIKCTKKISSSGCPLAAVAAHKDSVGPAAYDTHIPAHCGINPLSSRSIPNDTVIYKYPVRTAQ